MYFCKEQDCEEKKRDKVELKRDSGTKHQKAGLSRLNRDG